MIARPKRLPVTLTEEAQEEPLAVRPRQHPQAGRTKVVDRDWERKEWRSIYEGLSAG